MQRKASFRNSLKIIDFKVLPYFKLNKRYKFDIEQSRCLIISRIKKYYRTDIFKEKILKKVKRFNRITP